MQSVSKYLLQDTSKFFEYVALEGERIGQMQRQISELSAELHSKSSQL